MNTYTLFKDGLIQPPPRYSHSVVSDSNSSSASSSVLLALSLSTDDCNRTLPLPNTLYPLVRSVVEETADVKIITTLVKRENKAVVLPAEYYIDIIDTLLILILILIMIMMESESEAAELLDKIIQVPFCIPHMTRLLLMKQSLFLKGDNNNLDLFTMYQTVCHMRRRMKVIAIDLKHRGLCEKSNWKLLSQLYNLKFLKYENANGNNTEGTVKESLVVGLLLELNSDIENPSTNEDKKMIEQLLSEKKAFTESDFKNIIVLLAGYIQLMDTALSKLYGRDPYFPQTGETLAVVVDEGDGDGNGDSAVIVAATKIQAVVRGRRGRTQVYDYVTKLIEELLRSKNERERRSVAATTTMNKKQSRKKSIISGLDEQFILELKEIITRTIINRYTINTAIIRRRKIRRRTSSSTPLPFPFPLPLPLPL